MSRPFRRLVVAALCLAVAACAAPGTFQSPGATAALPGTATISAEALATPITLGSSTREEVAARLGRTTRVRFDSGFEVWVYRFAGEPGGRTNPGASGPAEYVVLFTPSGIVAKTRFRPAPAGSGGADGR